MFGSIRIIKARLAQKLSGRWGPAVDEATVITHPWPWELDRDGRLTDNALRSIARIAGRNWMSIAGPGGSYASRLCRDAAVGSVHAKGGGFTAMGRLTVTTRFAGREGGYCLLSHRIESANGAAVAFTSRFAVSPKAEWSVFPPYAAAELARAEV